MTKYVIFLFIFLFSAVGHAQAGIYLPQEHFPVNYKMRKRVDFWKKVFTEIDSTKGYIHDAKNPHLIYEIINIKGLSKKNRIRTVKFAKNRIKNNLRKIRRGLTKDSAGKKLLELLEKAEVKNSFSLQKNIRFQRGMADRYFTGLKRSYKYIRYIKNELQKYKVPLDLAYLPHVESSFNYRAYSKVGAAGIWQLMPLTAKNYGLKINRVIDERRDPIHATRAAAKLLRDNYKRFKSWPLALTAYNHGPGSVARAVRKVGSSNISNIIDNYQNKRFGFASKNFYATFVATAEVSKQVKNFFPSFKKPKSLEFFSLIIPKSIKPYPLIKSLKLDEKDFKYLNLSIRPYVFKYDLHLPKKFKIRIPKKFLSKRSEIIVDLKRIKTNKSRGVEIKAYKVRPGENIYSIAKKFNILKSDILSNNFLKNPSFIMAGMYLKIPIKKPKTKKVLKSGGIYSLVELGKELFSLKVMPNETLSHYVDWSRVRKNKLIDKVEITKMRIGRNIKLKLKSKNKNDFELRRIIFHKRIKSAYFKKYSIIGIQKYEIKSGDTLEKISRTHKIPLWLLFTLNENGAFSNFSPGEKIELPRIKRKI